MYVRLWNPDRTVRFDRVNRKPFIKTVLLTSKTGLYEKLSWTARRFNLTGLKTVDGCHGSCRFSDSEFFFFFFFGYLQLSHWWSFNLRHWDCTTICSYSSFQSRSPSLSLSLCVFADGCFCFFFFVCVFFVCCFCSFSLLRFSFEPTESFGLFEGDWQLAFCHPLNASCQPLPFKFYWV